MWSAWIQRYGCGMAISMSNSILTTSTRSIPISLTKRQWQKIHSSFFTSSAVLFTTGQSQSKKGNQSLTNWAKRILKSSQRYYKQMRAITALLFIDGGSNSTNSSNTTSINKNKRILSSPKARSFIHTLEEMMSSLSRSTLEMTSSFTSSNRGWKFCCSFISMGCRLSSRSSIHGFTT